MDALGILTVILACVVVALVVAFGMTRRRGDAEARRRRQWLLSGVVLAGAVAVGGAAGHVLGDIPADLETWIVASLFAIPLTQVAGALVRSPRTAERTLSATLIAAGLVALTAATYLVLVAGITGPPHGHERAVLLASLMSAAGVGLLARPVRRRMRDYAHVLIGARRPSTQEVVTTFEARMSRAVPMDELMLQLAESLHATVSGARAEIWTDVDGVLTRTVSVPRAAPHRLSLGQRERAIVGQTRIGGAAWTQVWLPELVDPTAGDLRVAPVAHLGGLLGLLVVHRPVGAPAFVEADDAALVEVARQLGLALHNLRLDSALQASMAELAERNAELQASRLRIVNAADASRRQIERDLHDGAQQHLVALAVRISILRQLAAEGGPELPRLLDELREQVQATIAEVRELAHGIYPPLLRDRGLGEALEVAAARCPIQTIAETNGVGRYPEAVEAAAYFCCLEAMQNAVKHAGPGATLTVRIHPDPDGLAIDLVDDGVGFDPTVTATGHGFTNMRDRLGAVGGVLDVQSAPGCGVTVRLRFPAAP